MHLIRRAMLVCAVAIVALLGTSRSLHADEADAGQRAFIKDYVAALASGDATTLKQLLHPAALACISGDNQDYFDFLLANDLRHAGDFGAGHKVTRIAALVDGAPSLSFSPDLLFYPVAPTHEFQIDTHNGQNRFLILIRTMASVDGHWFNVIPCPTEAGLHAFRAARAKNESQQARAKQLAADLRDPLLSQVRELLTQRRRMDAMELYKSKADVDLTTASRVIDVLDGK
jgi:hypothetical protein